MTQPIDIQEVNELITHYYRRLARTTPDKPTLRRANLLKTILVLQHYRDLCAIIDGPIEDVKQ